MICTKLPPKAFKSVQFYNFDFGFFKVFKPKTLGFLSKSFFSPDAAHRLILLRRLVSSAAALGKDTDFIIGALTAQRSSRLSYLELDGSWMQ